MRKVHFEIRPMKDDRVVMKFDTRPEAKTWIRRRNQTTGWHVPVRLVEVITYVAERVEVL